MTATAVFEYATFAVLCAATVAAALAARRHRGLERAFWAIAAAGLAALTIDERLSLHERAGRSMWESGVATPVGFNHLDDVILAAIALCAALFILLSWKVVVANRRVAAWFGVALALGLSAVAWDSFGPIEPTHGVAIEEVLELGAVIAAFAAAGRAARLRLRPLSLPEAATSEPPVPLTG